MRIINIISNELITKQMKLENELERVLNSNNIETEDRVQLCLKTINELTEVHNNITTFKSYIDKEVKKEN
jgi:hypothetical protein|tara:strand:- start:3717 stop:3926 length:210 start_codon:yes stop_codon:yes gene_type:complete